MANDNLIHIDQRELDKLNMSFRRFEKELLETCRFALANLGQRIVAEAQTRLKRNKNIASAALIESGATKVGADETIMAGFPIDYAYYVEYGRKAGNWPPFRFIYEWVRKKHLKEQPHKPNFVMKRDKGVTQKKLSKGLRYNPHESYDSEERSIAFLIQRSIGEKGSRPYPFLRPAYEKNKRLLIQVLKKGAAKVMNKDYTYV